MVTNLTIFCVKYDSFTKNIVNVKLMTSTRLRGLHGLGSRSVPCPIRGPGLLMRHNFSNGPDRVGKKRNIFSIRPGRTGKRKICFPTASKEGRRIILCFSLDGQNKDEVFKPALAVGWLVGCGVNVNCPLVGSKPVGGVPSVGSF